MAFTTGTATNCRDLTSKFITWVTTSGGWTNEFQQNTTGSTGTDATGGWSDTKQEVVLSNDGPSGNETILVGIREWEHDSNSAWGWDLNAYLSVPTLHFGENLGGRSWTSYNSSYNRWSNLPQLQLSNGTMNYWFYANDLRIIVVVRTSSIYHSCHIGFGVRLSTAAEYPFPYYIAGSYYGNAAYTTGGYGPVRASRTANGVYNNFFICEPDNSFTRSYTTNTGYTLPNPGIMPMQGEYNYNSSHTSAYIWADSAYRRIDNTAAGNKILIPNYVMHNGRTLMELSELYAFPYVSLSSEDTYTDQDSDTYRIFQQGSSVSHYAFMAVKE